METISFSLKPRPPFRLDFTVWALRRRPGNIIDRWENFAYRRVVVFQDQPIDVIVTQTGSVADPELNVAMTSNQSMSQEVQSKVAETLERMLGFERDLSDFYLFAKDDARLWAFVEPFLGFRPPTFPTIFETIVNGIACQQVTLTLGILLLNRLAEARGLPMLEQGVEVFSFPEPEALKDQSVEDLRKLGFSGQKARALTELSKAVVEGNLNLESLGNLDDDTIVERLTKLRGVGRWTADYVLLRGLGRVHVFPVGDVGARNNLQRWLGITEPIDFKSMHQVLERFQPYGGLVYFHLLLNNLARAGYISAYET